MPLQPEAASAIANRAANSNLARLVSAYRTHGHKNATLDPLAMHQLYGLPAYDAQLTHFYIREARELDPALYGVNAASTEKVSTEGLVSGGASLGASASVADVVTFLSKVYCSTIGAEFEFTVWMLPG